YHLVQSHLKDVSSADFRDNLIAATGLTNLNDFFNDWVFNPGWPHFSIDSVASTPNGPNTDVTVYVRQKLFGAPALYTNVPLQVSFFDANGNREVRTMQMSGQNMSFQFTLPFAPVYTAMDFDEKISDALTAQTQTVSTTGAHNFATARMNMTVTTITDSTLIRVEHNYVAPDPIQNNTSNFRISSKRYWNVDGMLTSGFHATARFYYDGRTTTTSGGANYLDNDLAIPNGDSIILLYRPSPADDWTEYPHYTKSVIGQQATSKYGYVNIDTLYLGQYCFANGVSTVLIGVDELADEAPTLLAYPNPAGEQITLEWSSDPGAGPILLEVYDIEGRLVHSEISTTDRVYMQAARWNAGMYQIRAMRAGKLIGDTQIIIRH
ncbi:MAG: T9SS type A sorting domain-containing protein, partial [Bacteroidia bacterium]